MNKVLTAFVIVMAFVATMGAAKAPTHRPVAPGGPLSKVFTSDMLGARVAYFESKLGPAWKVNGAERLYKIAGCEIGVYELKGDIVGLGITRLSPRCSFSLAGFVATDAVKNLPPLPQMTFGEFESTLGGGTFDADCLSGCGNAADPSVYDRWEGPHALGFLQVRLEAVQVDSAAIDAAIAWAKIMNTRKGEGFADNGGFHCDHSFDPQAHKLFANVRITGITVGRIPGDEPICPLR